MIGHEAINRNCKAVISGAVQKLRLDLISHARVGEPGPTLRGAQRQEIALDTDIGHAGQAPRSAQCSLRHASRRRKSRALLHARLKVVRHTGRRHTKPWRKASALRGVCGARLQPCGRSPETGCATNVRIAPGALLSPRTCGGDSESLASACCGRRCNQRCRFAFARFLLDESGDRLDRLVDGFIQPAVDLERRLEPGGAHRHFVWRRAQDDCRAGVVWANAIGADVSVSSSQMAIARLKSCATDESCATSVVARGLSLASLISTR